MNIVLGILCAVLVVLGITELVRLAMFWWLKPTNAREFSIVVVPDNAENCEYLVRAAAERMRWLDFKEPCKLICVNESENPEIDNICRFLALSYPYLKVSKKENLVYNILERSKGPGSG